MAQIVVRIEGIVVADSVVVVQIVVVVVSVVVVCASYSAAEISIEWGLFT